jgi:hypothetical protein
MKEPIGLESSVGSAERLCQEVNDLLAKVRDGAKSMVYEIK